MRRVPCLRQQTLLPQRSTASTSTVAATHFSSSSSSTISVRALSSSAPRCARTPPTAQHQLFRTRRKQESDLPTPKTTLYPGKSDSARTKAAIRAFEEELKVLKNKGFVAGSSAVHDAVKTTQRAKYLKTYVKPTRAPAESDVDEAGYTPAADGRGLDAIGGKHDWWNRFGHWGPESVYESFAPKERINRPELAELLLRQAVIEALCVRKEREEGKLIRPWVRSNREALLRAMAIKIKITEDGLVAIRGNSERVVRGLMPSDNMMAAIRRKDRQAAAEAALTEEEQAMAGTVRDKDSSSEVDPYADFKDKTGVPLVYANEVHHFIGTFGTEWKKIGLRDTRLKFAVAKRLFQLTGHNIPDAFLDRIDTVEQLYNIVTTKPPPQKLYDLITEKPQFKNLFNIAYHRRRMTPRDRETLMGRQKLIDEELKKRGLPIKGHIALEPHREVAWDKGRFTEKDAVAYVDEYVNMFHKQMMEKMHQEQYAEEVTKRKMKKQSKTRSSF